MKYDLKAMEFVPDEARLLYAFQWDETPDGEDYWCNQDENGITPEGQAKWDAMKRQWNEENAPAPDSPSMHGMLSEMWKDPTVDNCRCTTTPQRYVVVTGDETVICTRAEAEDLAAGGVDAVYKLGDKVEVTVKVEFE